MRVLDYHAGGNYVSYIKERGHKALDLINERIKSINTKEDWEKEQKRLIDIYKGFYPEIMFAKRHPIVSKVVSKYEYEDYRVENVLFESYPGWFVNGSVYLPKKEGKYPAIVAATGHSNKSYDNYALPSQLLAKSGYIVISFDEPGIFSEHKDENGNNHFEDGVRSYLSGFWIQTFFILDAIYCLDYLETRDDVIQECGFAATGNSGGGATTYHLAILDDRIKYAVPVCSVSDEAFLALEDRYTYCCEDKAPDQWINGIDSATLLSLSAPKPMLLCSGKNDEIADYKLAINVANKIKRIHSFYNSTDMDIFIDVNATHAYTASMVNQVLVFLDKHMKGIERPEGYYKYTYEDYKKPNPEELLCYPPDTATFYTANMACFKNAQRALKTPEELAEYLGVKATQKPEKVEPMFTSKPVWVHTIRGLKINVNKHTDVPALLFERHPEPVKNIILYADDKNKWDPVVMPSALSQKMGFLQRERIDNEASIMTFDITGIGELEIEKYYFDLSSWSTPEKLYSYLSITLGTSITAQRTMEMIAVINYVKNSHKYEKITCAAKGIAAIPMLYAAYITGLYDKLTLINLPLSYESIAKHVPNPFMPTSVIKNSPENVEIYEIVNAMDNVTLVNPIEADGRNITLREIAMYYKANVNVIINDEGLKPEYL